MGDMHMASLSKATRLKRSTLYIHVEDLARRGLIEKVIRGKRTYYRSANPKKLLSVAERDKGHLEALLPSLLALFEARGREPVARVYTGKEGLRNVYRLVETESLWVKTLFAPKSFFSVFTENESTSFAQTLQQNGVKMQSLLLNDAISKEFIKNELQFDHQLRLLPKTYHLTANIILWAHSVALISYENLYAVVIENNTIAKFHEDVFDNLWKGK